MELSTHGQIATRPGQNQQYEKGILRSNVSGGCRYHVPPDTGPGSGSYKPLFTFLLA